MKLRLFISLSMVVVGIGQSIGQNTVTLYPTADVSVYNLPPSNTGDFRTNTTLSVGRTSGGVVSQSLFNFDLTSIPSNAIITNASLVLTLPTGSVESAAQNNSFKVERFTNMPTWTEITSPMINGAYTFPRILNSTITSSDAVLTSVYNNTNLFAVPIRRYFNLTDHVQKMVSKQWANKGWVLKAINEVSGSTTGGIYYSRNCIPAPSTGCATSPQLEIKYVLPFSIQSATVTHATGSNANGSISATIINGPTHIGSQNVYTWYNSTGAVIPGSTSSPTITGLLPGWYGLKVQRNVLSGIASVDKPFYMAFLVGAQCASTSIAFNPGPNYIDDAPISTANAEAANGVAVNMNAALSRVVQFSGGTTTTATESGLRFRLWVDNQLSINKADLVLSGSAHVSSATAPNTAQLMKLTGDWNENFACWNNLHSISLSALPAPLTLAATTNPGNQILDLVPFWIDWKQNNLLNYGLLLRSFPGITMPASSFSTNMNFNSSDFTTDLTKRPQINFTVTAGSNAGCLPTNIGEVPYSVLKTNFDGGYATTFQKQVKFTFQEEYDVAAAKFLPYEIFNDMNVFVAGSTITGYVTGGATALPLKFDDNRYILNILNVTGLSLNTYFTLVVTTPKGDKKKLKVFYKN